MQNLKARLRKLEQKSVGEGLFIVVKTSSEDPADVNAVVAAEGIDPEDPRHQLVVLRVLFADINGNTQPPGEPCAQFLYALPRKN